MKIIKTANHIKLSATQKEKKDFFEKRTKKHIERVQNAAKKIVDKYPEYEKLLEQAEEHDASKFKEPEMTPYIELTWLKKNNQDDKNNQEIKKATLHHIKNNKHHPEYHNKSKAHIDTTNRDKSIKCIDAFDMDDISLAEMVSDWQAMSEELKTNTSREWYDDVKNVRWRWNKYQEKLIDKFLKVFE
jgi:tRNA U34 5-carboxymethylaminomethyl modifying enzyme MnmG/GidA